MITPARIRTYCNIAATVTDAQYARFIKDAENMDVVPLLGYPLYKALLDNYNSSPSLPTEKYEKLYSGTDYDEEYCFGIEAYIAYCVYYRMLRENSIQMTAFGVVKKTDSNSEPLGGDDLTGIINIAKEKADFYRKSIERYLRCNYGTYPLYSNSKKRNINYKSIGD